MGVDWIWWEDMLIDCGDKCRHVKISNPKIEDVVLRAAFELPIIILLAAGNLVCVTIK